MSKDPTTKADGLRAMREASRGHLQATADTPAGAHAPLPKKLIPFAGKDRAAARHGGGKPYSKNPKVKK